MRPSRFIPVAAALLGVLLAAGCGSDDDSASGATTPATSATSESATSTETGTTVDVAISGGKVTPDPTRKVEVSSGDHVHIRVTSDDADEVHVHGYDIETEVRPGETTDIDFTADIPGQFEVEAHELSPPLLFTLVVQ